MAAHYKPLQWSDDHCPGAVARIPWLATCLLADGDTTTGTAIGAQALDAARDLTSPRLLEQLAPLQTQASRRPCHEDTSQLAHELQLLRTAG